jgi:hypothetical protein
MSQVKYTILLNTDKHADLIEWIEAQQNKSAAIRTALRRGMRGGSITNEDIYNAVMELKANGLQVGLAEHGAAAGDEPEDIAATLDTLGL